MYVPKHFAEHDSERLLAVMRDHSFATIVSTVDGEPFATHAPVRVDVDDAGGLTIEGHLAKANPQARAFDDGVRTLVVFNGPHTYISPTLYRSAGRVPTWNYIAVHALGSARTLHDREAKRGILDRLVAEHEPTFATAFAAFEDRQRDGLLDAIVGFHCAVERLEGKFKLGQHRLADDLPEMQAVHENGDADRRSIARWMKTLGYWS